MGIERKIDEKFWVLIDTEPEQYGIKDSKWNIKETNLFHGIITDVSNDATVQELIDSFTPWTTQPLVDDPQAYKGDRNVRIDGFTVDEVNPGERFYFGDSTSVIYKIIETKEVGPDKKIKLDRRLQADVPNNTKLKQVGNTGTYNFSHSIESEGDYSIHVTSKNTNPLIDLRFGLIKIRDFNLKDVQENFDSMDSTVIEILSKIKNLDTEIDDLDLELDGVAKDSTVIEILDKIKNLDYDVGQLDLELEGVAKDATSVEVLTRVKSMNTIMDEIRDDVLGLDRSRILL